MTEWRGLLRYIIFYAQKNDTTSVEGNRYKASLKVRLYLDVIYDTKPF